LLALTACTPPPAQTPAAPASTTIAPADLSAFFDCLRTNSQAIAAAHRGGPYPGYAENSIFLRGRAG
jgi:hypothetical protein